jgi:molybdopterin-guanine dinucleotide biosynthesis protein
MGRRLIPETGSCIALRNNRPVEFSTAALEYQSIGETMRLVMVGGHTRNIGKTSVVEGIIRATRELNWTAAKITQFGHGVCSVNGEVCGCAVSEHQFSITEERQQNVLTDTARFLAAGARRSLWVRTKQGELITALPAFKKRIEGDEFVIVESNSLRRFMIPAIYLQVLDTSNPDFKFSAQQYFDLSDAFVLVERNGGMSVTSASTALLAREIEKNKPCFTVREQDRFISDEVIEFVRAKLGVENTDVDRRLQPAC